MKLNLAFKLVIWMFFVGCAVQPIVAQTLPSFPIQSYRDAKGKLYWNRAQEVYVSLSSTPNGKRENLEGESTGDYDNPFYFDTEGKNYIRSKWAVNKETKKTIYPQQELLFEVYADGLAPITKHTYQNATYYYQNKNKIRIYGKNLSFSLSAKDGVSGVQTTMYSINGKAYAKYSNPLKVQTSGKQVIKYFSVDNVGNMETLKESSFMIDIAPPKSNCTVLGIKLGEENIVALKSKIYLEATDDVSGVYKIYYTIDGGSKLVANGNPLNLSVLKDGSHVLKYYAVDHVKNEEKEQEFKFYLDKTAPITASDVLGDRFIVDDQIYFSGRTKLKLTAVDNKSGVKDVLFSIDGKEFESYEDPFYLPSEQGFHMVKYFALDNTENLTVSPAELGKKYLQFKHTVDKIYLDLTGPSLNYSISGSKFYTRDTIFVGPTTKINLRATDKESGLQYISYSLDNQQKENVYNKPFTLGDKKSGMHKVEYFGYDNVNNRNIGQFYVFLDTQGPEIGHKFSVLPIGKSESGVAVYPAYCSVFVTLQDLLTGVGKIYYSINGGQFLPYKNFITNFQKNKTYNIKIKALDKLGNESIQTIMFSTK